MSEAANTQSPPWIAYPIGLVFLFFAGVGFYTITGVLEPKGKAVRYADNGELGKLKPIEGKAITFPSDIRDFVRNFKPPPGELQADTRVIVEFIAPEMIGTACLNHIAKGCAYPGEYRIKAPNPCAFAETDGYAAILCHELGHLHGWDHPGPEQQDDRSAYYVGAGLRELADGVWSYADELYEANKLRRNQSERKP